MKNLALENSCYTVVATKVTVVCVSVVMARRQVLGGNSEYDSSIKTLEVCDLCAN